MPTSPKSKLATAMELDVLQKIAESIAYELPDDTAAEVADLVVNLIQVTKDINERT